MISSSLSYYVPQHLITRVKKNPIAHEQKFHRMSAEPVALSLIRSFDKSILLTTAEVVEDDTAPAAHPKSGGH